MGGDLEDVRSWSDAPEDILAVILSKLYPGGVDAFYEVCKAWSKVKRHKVAIQRILSDENLCNCPFLIFPNTRFFHPLYDTWFTMDTVPALPKGVILAQHYGWLLLRFRDDNAFYYNPFTGERMDLHDYPTACSSVSAPPTSPDCQIFGFHEYINDEIGVRAIKRGEEEFCQKSVCKSGSFYYRRDHMATFFQGKHYCLGRNGSLAIYNPIENKLCVTENAEDLWEHFYASDCLQYLLEGEGNLWAVFVAVKGEEICICKLNQNQMRWEIVHDLGNKMIFLSYHGCMMEKAKVKDIGNKIYFPILMKGHCLFYCLATKRYHTFAKGRPSYKNFEGSQHMLQCAWIKMNSNPCLLKL